MFIQRIKKVVKEKTYQSVLILKSVREGKKVRHKTILNISKLPEMVIAAIEFALKNDNTMNLKELKDLKGLKQHQGKSFGALYTIIEICKRLGITDVLGKNRKAMLTLIMIAGRIICQRSRWYIAQYWSKTQGIEEVLKYSGKFDEDDLYETLAWLSEHQEEIEQKLWQSSFKENEKTKSIFLYDVTSSYVEGNKNELAEYGLNRDEIKGKKQIVIGLLTDVNGEPLSVQVFPGNTNDHKSVVNQLEKIKKIYGAERVVFVGDRGMLKSEQIKGITDAPNHWNYITAITKLQIEKMLREDVIQIGLFDEDLCEVENEGIRYILRKNPIRAEEIRSNLDKRLAFIKKKADERNKYLTDHPKAKSATACRYLEGEIKRRKLDKILGLREYEDRRFRIEVNEAEKEEHLRLAGCYVIKTDVPATEMDKETIHSRYKDLSKVEQAFETLKSGLLEIRPINVRKESSVRGHVFICMLALKVTHYLEKMLKELNFPIKYVLDTLNEIQYREIVYTDCYCIKTLPDILSDDQARILQTLKITLPKQL